MATGSSISIVDRAKRAGCWAVGLYGFALFFALGAIISLLNADILRALGGAFLTALSLGTGIWLARRASGAGKGRAASQPTEPNRPAPRKRSATPRKRPAK